MQRPIVPLALVATVVLAAACDSRRVDPSELDRVVVSDRDAQRQLDILFVIENSATSTQQAGLIAAFPAMLDGLRGVEGGLPDLHVGVTSTDLGVGAAASIGNCDIEGDAGRLLNEARTPGCAAPVDGYLDDREDPDCTAVDPDLCRIQNFSGGDLAASFACIAAIGADGCGFEQPLEAMRRALVGNPGFLRDEAYLAVVLVGLEDDCSVNDPIVFEIDPSVEPTVGPFGSYRCFHHGVACDPDVPLEAGTKLDCASREDSAFIHPLARYRDVLASIKDYPSHVTVTAVTGPIEPVAVGRSKAGTPELIATCPSALQHATPGIRINQLVAAIGGEVYESCNETQSEVDDQMTQAGAVMVERLGRVLDGACLDGYVFDQDGDRTGIQADCEVVEGAGVDDVPSCADDPEARPCFEIRPAEICEHTATSLAVFVERDQPPPPGTVVRASCVVRLDDDPSRSFYDCSAGGEGAAAWLVGLAALALGRRPRATGTSV